MFKLFLITFLLALTSCSTPKETITIGNTNDIKTFVSLAPIIMTQYPNTTCGLKTFRIADANLKDSLSSRNVSSLSITYFHDTMNASEYFYGNNIKLPDSCIIFGKDDYNSMDKKIKSDLFFYFFAKSKPTSFKFSTFEPITERTNKINDSIWIYQSVHQLIGL